MRAPSLSIACAEVHPGLVEECVQAMRGVFPNNSVCKVRRKGCWEVKLYSLHMWCLFPPARPRQKSTSAASPSNLGSRRSSTRTPPGSSSGGLIHSDGCRITNWTTRLVGGERKRYEYPRYFFTNVSDDIRQLFTGTLDKLGIEWTHCTRNGNPPYNISVAKKASVALMDAHVGPKH